MDEFKRKPWAVGPFELIRHANEHLQSGNDTDRRIAIIGFDNAIEVSIDVFLKLHPWLRDGYEISNDDVQKAVRNYYSKIEFLDRYVQSKSISVDVPVLPIVWYHSLRNELYHSGNGMVPEMHVLEGSRAAAITVFNALFGFDVTLMLGLDASKISKPQTSLPYISENPQMDYLRVFIEFETKLKTALSGSGQDIRLAAPSSLWQQFVILAQVPLDWNETVKKAIRIRNQVAHGQAEEIATDELNKVATDLQEITSKIDKFTWGKIKELK
jgi:hypothetical protein